jgi:hypothetical protein
MQARPRGVRNLCEQHMSGHTGSPSAPQLRRGRPVECKTDGKRQEAPVQAARPRIKELYTGTQALGEKPPDSCGPDTPHK